MSQQLGHLAARDLLWAQLSQLRPKIDEMAARIFDGSDLEKDLLALIAKIMQTELDYRKSRGDELNVPPQ